MTRSPLRPAVARGRRTLLACATGGVVALAGLLGVPGDAAPADRPAPDRVASARAAAPLASRGQMMSTVRDLVDMAPRATGTPGGKRAAAYVARRLREAGMDEVWIERTTSYSWKASGDSLRVAGQEIDQHPIGFSFIKGPTGTGVRTLGRAGLDAPVVDLGGDPLRALREIDVRGKIVMVDLKFLTPLAALSPLIEFIHDPQGEILDAQTLLTPNPYITSLPYTIDALQAAGAAGMIGVLADYFESNKYFNEYYRRSPMTIPGMWVTKKEAVRLRRLLRRDPTATMRLTTTRRAVVARQPIGILRGSSRQTVMVQSHHDSLGPGAVEDATGVAQVLALAEHYGAQVARGARPTKTLMFTTMDSHFTGYQSHMHFVDEYVENPRSPYRIAANVTIEHIAKKGRIGPDGQLQLLDEVEPRGFFENLAPAGKAMMIDTILRHDLRATTMLNGTLMQAAGGIPTDASFTLAAGVPTISLIAGPIYLYDELDDLDAVAQGEMVPILRAHRDFIDWLDRTPAGRIGLPTPGALLDVAP